MKLIKLLIPSGETKGIDELQSYTVKWSYKTGWMNAEEIKHKVFIDKSEAENFENTLIMAAKTIGCYISTSLYKN